MLSKGVVAEKSREINAIFPRRLALLELEGALVTIDAMGCHTEIAKAIRATGAVYVLALKDNWHALVEAVQRAFDTALAGTLATHVTTDGYPCEWRFPDLAMIGMVEAEVERNGRTSIARRYYLSAAPLTARAFAAAVRPTGAASSARTPR